MTFWFWKNLDFTSKCGKKVSIKLGNEGWEPYVVTRNIFVVSFTIFINPEKRNNECAITSEFSGEVNQHQRQHEMCLAAIIINWIWNGTKTHTHTHTRRYTHTHTYSNTQIHTHTRTRRHTDT